MPAGRSIYKVMSKLGYAIAATLAIAAMGVAWQAWQAMANVQVSAAGTIAMILGAVGTLALGGGLIALMFISNRRGIDDEAGGPLVRGKSDKSGEQAPGPRE